MSVISYDKLIKSLKKRFIEVEKGEFIVTETEVWGQALKLVVAKVKAKNDIKRIEEEMKKDQLEVEKPIKKFAILFYMNQVIFMIARPIGRDIKIHKLRKDLNKISPAFFKKYVKLLNNPGTLSIWDELFDRTDIIEEFYKLYTKARNKIIAKVRGIYDDIKKEEFADNLLMQVLIVWYLQERGFLDENTNYLVKRFKDYKKRGFDSYYNFLKHLFNVMMREPNDSIYHVDNRFGKIVVTGPAPFLNGEFGDVTIPDDVFYIDGKTDELRKSQPKDIKNVPILNLFESRDWTEGNIDEYVLGAIFEKLMIAKDRKEKGAYYTPEPITEYICNNTIKPYLVLRINKERGTNYKSLEEFFEVDNNEDNYRYIFDLLQRLKILDPAVGSGHFLETAINVLVGIYEKIFEKARKLDFSYDKFTITSANEKGELVKESLLAIDDEEERKLKLKFHIILSRNIYGIDILPSAIRVARARLFMSLAKHFNVKKGTHIRFPNVHFNLRAGNSLIGFASLDAFEKMSKQITLEDFLSDNGEKLDLEIERDLRDYIKRMDMVLGTKASPLFDEVKTYYSKELKLQRLLKVLRLRSDLIKIMLISLNTDYAIRLKKFIDELTKRFNLKLNKEFLRYLEDKGIEAKEKQLEKIGYFHWIMELSEVFLRKKWGFDIIIGNPPHGAKVDKLEKEIWKTNYSLVKGGVDSAKIFIERSMLLLRKNAPLSFVIPKPSTYSYSWEDFRSFILQFEISHCIDLGKAFKNVKHEQIALIAWKRSNTRGFYLGGYYDRTSGTISEMSTIPNTLTESTGVLLSKLDKNEIEIAEYLIKQKFSNMGSCDVFRGLPRNLSSENGERCIKGKDIGRYFIRFPQEFIDTTTVNERRILRLKRKKIIAQNIVAHTLQPFDRIIIMAFPDTKSHLTFETVTNIVPDEEDTIKSITLILNSRFVSWFVYSIIYNKAIRDMHFDNYFVRRILLPDFKKDVMHLNTLCDILLFLNTCNDIRQSFRDLINFIDKELIEALVFELYFKKKFIEESKEATKECNKEVIYDQLEKGPFLIDLVKRHLKPIDYDSYFQFVYSTIALSKEDRLKMNMKKEEYLKIIKAIVESIKSDKEIIELIKRIKQHKWVRVIEKT